MTRLPPRERRNCIRISTSLVKWGGRKARWPLVLGTLVLTLAAQGTAPPGNQAANTITAESRILPPAPGYHFPDRRTYIYEVDWRLFTAGIASLRMEATDAEQRITAAADSTGVVALLYHVHDRFEAYFDRRNFCSSLITKHVEEGFRRVDTTVHFEYSRGQSVMQQKNLKTGQTRQLDSPISGCGTDVVSGIYYIASLPLESGMTYTFPLNDGGKTVDVKVAVEARESITTPAGTFQTIRVQPSAASGVLKDKGRVWIWYSNDADRIPVQMRARLFWGTITFRLQRVETK